MTCQWVHCSLTQAEVPETTGTGGAGDGELLLGRFRPLRGMVLDCLPRLLRKETEPGERLKSPSRNFALQGMCCGSMCRFCEISLHISYSFAERATP